MHRILFLSFLFLIICLTASAQSTSNGSPCSQQTYAHPFCTDDNPYGITFPSGETGNAEVFFPNSSSSIGCLYSAPRPAWYFMQINTSGSLTFVINQTCGDVDFACWGPFTAMNQTDFMNQLCTGQYNFNISYHGNNQTDNGYPYGNLVDCSYSIAATETCHIPNAQAGEWYLVLITNYIGGSGTISFSPTASSTATTNCNLLNSGDSNSPICEGGTLELYVTAPQNGATYNWTGPNGFSQSTTNTTLSVPNVTANMTGEYHMTMTGISQNSNEAVVDVQIIPRPTPEIVAEDESLCMGESTVLSVNSTFELTWFAETFSGSSSSKIAEYVNSVTVSPTESTHYILKADNDGCIGRDTIDIIVNPNPVIEVTIDNPTLCYGESATITASGGTHYSWSNGSNSSTIHVTPTQTTIYNVEVQTDALCGGDTTVEIIVYPAITEQHEITSSHCNQAVGSITMYGNGGMGPFTYTSNTATFTENIASNLHAGSYTITATDSVGCSITTTLEVSEVPGPTPCFLFSSNDDVNMVITNCTQGDNNYFWDFGDGVTSTETHPIHEYTEPGRYSVVMIAADAYNCIDSLRQDYVINGPVYIANAFTPNGDGINDEMSVIGKTIQKDEFIWAIYDRHGVLVFLSLDPAISWDGTIQVGKNKSKNASPGVYVYRLKYKDVNGNYFERDGNITLIR